MPKTIQEIANKEVWNPSKIPRKSGGTGQPGYPGIDWKALFEQWCATNMCRRDFLTSLGLSSKNENCRHHTMHWTNKARQAYIESKIKHGEQYTDNHMWELIRDWQKQQVRRDYESGEAVRTHCKLLLNLNLSYRIDDAGNKIFSTALTPREIKDIAYALNSVQKIQRLALGMSTDNIGVDGDARNIAREENEGKGPTFVVQLTESGKFTQQRPKQVN